MLPSLWRASRPRDNGNGLKEEQVFAVDEGDELEACGGEQGSPLVAHGQDIRTDRAVEVGVKIVDVGAGGEVHDDDPAAGFEGRGEVLQGGGLVAEVWEAV